MPLSNEPDPLQTSSGRLRQILPKALAIYELTDGEIPVPFPLSAELIDQLPGGIEGEVPADELEMGNALEVLEAQGLLPFSSKAARPDAP